MYGAIVLSRAPKISGKLHFRDRFVPGSLLNRLRETIAERVPKSYRISFFDRITVTVQV